MARWWQIRESRESPKRGAVSYAQEHERLRPRGGEASAKKRGDLAGSRTRQPRWGARGAPPPVKKREKPYASSDPCGSDDRCRGAGARAARQRRDDLEQT